jgi:hypothetical protein
MLVTTRRFGKIEGRSTGLEHVPGVAQNDPLDRALSNHKAVVLLQFDSRESERLIGGKIGDGALQRLRTRPRRYSRTPHERTNAFPPETVLRL